MAREKCSFKWSKAIMASCVCLALGEPARAQAPSPLGIEISGGLWSNQGWEAAARARDFGAQGTVTLGDGSSSYQPKGYADLAVDIRPWVGNWGQGWTATMQVECIGSGVSSVQINALASVDPSVTAAMASQRLSDVPMLASQVSKSLLSLSSGQASASMQTPAKWSIESSSIGAVHRWDLGMGFEWSLGGVLGYKKIKEQIFQSPGAAQAMSASRQWEAASFQSLREALLAVEPVPSDMSVLKYDLEQGAAKALSGKMTASERDLLIAGVGAWLQKESGKVTPAQMADLKNAMSQEVQALAMSAQAQAGSMQGESDSRGLLPLLSASVGWRGQGCGCSAILETQGMRVKSAYAWDYGVRFKKTLYRVSGITAGVEARGKWTKIHWTRDDFIGDSGGATQFDARSREVGLGLFVSY